MESSDEFISRLDRDSYYRITALQCAITRGGQDGGISGDPVDVFALAEQYYAWLNGKNQEVEKPVVEKLKGD